jgi:hypothetical protein
MTLTAPRVSIISKFCTITPTLNILLAVKVKETVI